MKRNQQGFGVIEILAGVVIVGLITGVGFLVYQRQHAVPKTIDAVLTGITNEAAKTYSDVQFQPKHDWSAEMSSTAFNKVDGYDYAVSGAGKGIWYANEYSTKTKTVKRFGIFSKTLQPVKSTDELKNWVGSELTTYGFMSSDHKTYRRAGDTCTVLSNSALYGQVDEDSNVVEVQCFGKQVVQQTAATMKPFVDEYLKHHTSLKASDMTVGPLTIKSKNGSGVIGSSHKAGYDIAELLVSTKAKKTQIALFYSKNANIAKGTNSGWHYVTEANDEFGFKCADMQTDADARTALYDQVCYTPTGQVRLDTDNRALQ